MTHQMKQWSQVIVFVIIIMAAFFALWKSIAAHNNRNGADQIHTSVSPEQRKKMTLAVVSTDNTKTIHFYNINSVDDTASLREPIGSLQTNSAVTGVAWAGDKIVWTSQDQVRTATGEKSNVWAIHIASVPQENRATSGDVLYQSNQYITGLSSASYPDSVYEGVVSFFEGSNAFVLNIRNGSVVRVSDSAAALAWSETGNAVALASSQGVEYVELNESGTILNRLVLTPASGARADAISFLGKDAVIAATGISNGVAIDKISLRGGGVVQHIERLQNGDSITSETVKRLQERVLGSAQTGRVIPAQGVSGVSLVVGPQKKANSQRFVAFSDPVHIAEVIDVKKGGDLLVEGAFALDLDEKPIMWQDASTLFVLQRAELRSLKVPQGDQKLLIANVASVAIQVMAPSSKQE